MEERINGDNGQKRMRVVRALALTVLLALALGGSFALYHRQSVDPIVVEISEVVSSNALSYVDEEYGAVDWIELHNAGNGSVSLSGWFLTDKYASLDTDCSLPNISLAPDGYCLIFADKEKAREGRHCLPFGLSKEGETLYLYNEEGEQVAQLKVPSLEKDVSWAKSRDGSYGYCLAPTPGKANATEILDEMPPETEAPADETFLGEAPLVISEVVSSNGVSLVERPYGAVDWIELHNRSDEDVSLAGWYLSDKDALSEACALPDVTIPARGYYVILADTDSAGKGDRCLPFSIRKAGETLYLFDPGSHQVAALTVPALEKDVSWALEESGQYGYCQFPTPGAANTAEIVSKLPAKAAADAPVPGRRSASQVRINEVCSATDRREADWIELFNPMDETVDIEGYYLTDSASDTSRGALPPLTIPANGYLVVSIGAAADPATGLTSFSISSQGETLYLFDGELGLVDMVDVPPLEAGLVFARDGTGAFGYCGMATPGAANGDGIYADVLRDMATDAPLHISEGLFRNRYSAIDAYGDHSDWVELVNRSGSTISLDGYYLSDRKDDLRQWALPNVELGPGAYLLVFLSGHDEKTGELHAPFSVSERDGGCYLYNARTLEVEHLPYPEGLRENVSIGLGEDGSLLYFGYPTPGYANASGFSQQDVCGLPGGDVLISEVSAGGDAGDWIELYNRGAQALDLTGWHLSDDERTPQKLALDGVLLEANKYKVVSLEKGEGNSPFSVSISGEELVLTDEKGIVRDVFMTGALRPGATSGRLEDDPGCQRVFFASATRGSRNTADTVAGFAAAPVFSQTELYHEAAFELALSAPEGTVIHYTLDGSAPTEQSPAYTGPLTIETDTVVRALGTAEGRFPSTEATATYLFRQPHTLPVVCIAADPGRWKALTNVPFHQSGLAEQLALISYYESDGTLGTAFPAGISPRGNASLSYPQKSLSIHLRGTYGQSAVTYPFWGQGSFLSYRFIVLRNGSQDIRSARLRDSFASRAAKPLHVMTAATRPVIVYVNGAYYGIMDLNEGMNQDYLWSHYGVDGDSVNIVQRNDYVKRGSAEGFVALRRFASPKAMAEDETVAEFAQKADMDAIIDYIIAQSFFGNYDIHNQNWWCATDGTILWQPFLYDVDRCLNEESLRSNVLSMYFNAHGVVHNRDGDKILMEIPCGLKQNEAWRQRFMERYAELLCTDLSESRLSALLDEMVAALRPEMAEHTARWSMPDSLEAWEKNVENMHDCLSRQYDAIVTQIKKQFSLSDAQWDEIIAKYR